MNKQYAAGFFDGEGCIIITKTTKQYALRCTLGNTNREVLEQLKSQWGGCIKLHNGFKVKAGWQWDIAANQAAHFLTDISPFLVIKREEALLGLEFQQEVSNRTKHSNSPEDWALREGYKLALSEMKK